MFDPILLRAAVYCVGFLAVCGCIATLIYFVDEVRK